MCMYLHFNTNCSPIVVLRAHTHTWWTDWWFSCVRFFVVTGEIALYSSNSIGTSVTIVAPALPQSMSKKVVWWLCVLVFVFLVVCLLSFSLWTFHECRVSVCKCWFRFSLTQCLGVCLCVFLLLLLNNARVQTKINRYSLARTNANSWTGKVILCQSKKENCLFDGWKWNSRQPSWNHMERPFSDVYPNRQWNVGSDSSDISDFGNSSSPLSVFKFRDWLGVEYVFCFIFVPWLG